MPDPVEKVEDLAAEAERGSSERTPWIALSGITAILAVVLGVMITIMLVIWWVAG